MTYRKKLIEVALPLEAINRESAREKSIRHGHPSTLHLWWARRPLAACRAVLFSSLVDDPSSRPEEFPTEEAQDAERQRLFRLIEELVKWDNSTNETVLAAARAEIMRSTDGNPPPVLDPFCGGGSIPLEAQRLGLEAHGSDLNPVPVLITKALVEIPPKFAGRPPVNPAAQRSFGHGAMWKGAAGLAEDVRYYGRWMRDEAERRIGHLYPKVRLPREHGGGEATVVAWLWVRTVPCPSPACGIQMPLLSSFVLSSKSGSAMYLHPIVRDGKVDFAVGKSPPTAYGDPARGLKRGMSGVFECAKCGTVTSRDYVASVACAAGLGTSPLALVAQVGRGRVYLGSEHVQWPEMDSRLEIADLDVPLSLNPRDIWCRNFGLLTPASLFTPRQLLMLTTFSDLVTEAREHIISDARSAGLSVDDQRLVENGRGAAAYADAVATYLGLGVSKLADAQSSLVRWKPSMDQAIATFGRQALPMVWDFAESNAFNGAAGDYTTTLTTITRAMDGLPAQLTGVVEQRNAISVGDAQLRAAVSTDPPYYDNIGYADLSDFFYVWMRRALADVYPALFGTLLTPKSEELIAASYRFGGDKGAAQRFFEAGLGESFARMHKVQDPRFPLTVFYAFKQAESADNAEDNGGGTTTVVSTGWETMLEGLIRAGFLVDGTWPIRTELANRTIASGTNALASSIVLVCRPRSAKAPSATRRQVLAELQKELPAALRNLQHGNIAPVDLAQAAIGPGMAVYSRYSRVLESDGVPMRVRTALALINQVLSETLAEQEGEMDADTRWALTWFDQFGFAEGPFGDANTLANAKNTSSAGLVEAGVVASARGKVRLLRRDELADDWDPATDARSTVWEAAHHLIRALEQGGEQRAASLLARLGRDAERARDLAYRLYTTCERRGWTQDAQAYNSLVVAWPDLTRLAAAAVEPALPTAPTQPSLAL